MSSMLHTRANAPTRLQSAAAGARASGPPLPAGLNLPRILKALAFFAPTLLAVLYFGLIATDRYVSEAQFVVRTPAKAAASGGLGALLQMTGIGRAQDDVFSVQAFLNSRNATDRLDEKLPVREMYADPSADFVARYPSLFYGSTAEELHKYLGWMISTSYSSTTGITTLSVQAFKPEDAKAVAGLLLNLGEETVNRMNTRIQADAVRVAEGEVKRNEDRLVEAQLAITRFRNAELMIDPAGSSIIVTELIGRLSAELTQTEAQIREIAASAATNPQLPGLRRRAEALQGQIAQERQRISGDADGLAAKLAVYERLVLDREFAKQTLSSAARSLETAQQEARRQQLYLERVVEPAAPDYPGAPLRLRMIATAFGLNLILGLVVWLILSGLREHSAHGSR